MSTRVQTPAAEAAPWYAVSLANAVAVLFWTGWLAASPFLPLHATALGAGPAAVGLILGGYHVVGLALSLPAGVASERWGSGRMMLSGAALGVGGTLLIAASRGLSGLTAGLVIAGLAQIMVSIGTQVETIRSVPREAVTHAIGRFFFLTSFAQVIGPALGAVLVGDARYRAVFLAAAALSALGAAASVIPARRPLDREGVLARPPAIESRRVRPARPAGHPGGARGDAGRRPRDGVLVVVLPLLLRTQGYGVGAIAGYFSVRAIASAAARPLMIVLIARQSRARVLAASVLAAAAMTAIMPFVRSPAAMGAVVVLFGLGSGIFFTLSAAAVASGFPPESAGVGVGTRMLMSRMGVILGPMVLGLVAQSLGYAAAFLAGTVILVAAVLFYLPGRARGAA